MTDSQHYVYIVECADLTLYTGYTTDVTERVRTHNGQTAKIGAKYTKARRPVRLVYQETFATRSEAMKREAQIKKLSRPEKKVLVAAGQ